jgi:hypothetical protein
MREIIKIPAEKIIPARENVLQTQCIPPGEKLSEELESLFRESMKMLGQFSRTKAVMASISIPEFELVYCGEGLNEEETPLGEIINQADHLALLAVTLGEEITKKIDQLFKTNEFAPGSMLDSVASAATDKAADIAEKHFLDLLSEQSPIGFSKAILRFSPGYCGWHMSGQKKLFEFLHPEEIGIELLESFLMKPLKSISGVMVLGEKGIFDFENTYAFCSECKSLSCLGRKDAVFGKTRSINKKGAL